MHSAEDRAKAQGFHFNLVFAYLITGIILLVAVFLFVTTVHAQTDDSTTEDTVQDVATEESNLDDDYGTASETGVEDAEEDIIEEDSSDEEVSEELYEAASEDADQDVVVTVADLEVKEARVLPDSPFYGFKRLFRAAREVVTVNPVKKAELRLRHASQELMDAKQVVEENAGDLKAVESAARAIERYEHKIEKIKNKADKINKKEGAGEFLDKMLDRQIKQQKVLDVIERQVVEKGSEAAARTIFEKVKKAQDKSAEHVGAFLTKVEDNQEKLADRIDRVMARQKGSEFKDIKNLEVLKRIEEKIPEVAREAIHQAQNNAFKRFVSQVDRIPQDQRADRFENYTRHIEGDQTRFLEVFDDIKSRVGSIEDVPEDIFQKLEAAKDIAARRFQRGIEEVGERFGDQEFEKEFRDRAFKRFHDQGPGGMNLGKMRALEEIHQRVQFENEELKEEMEVHRDAAIDKFKEVFTDSQSQEEVGRFKELSRKMAENPDPTTFRLLQELDKKVKQDPKKREFIEKMEREAKQEFAERMKEEGEKFFKNIVSSNPQDIEIFKGLQKDFAENPDEFFGPPPEFGPPGMGDEFGPPMPPPFMEGPPPGFAQFFDKAINVQSERIVEHLQDIEDPELFDNFQRKFEDAPPEILRELKFRQRGFENMFKDKREFIQEAELQMHEEKTRIMQEGKRQTMEDEFNRRFESVSSEEEREAIQEEFDKQQIELDEQDFSERKKIFEKRIQFDPFCDEACQQEESKRFDRVIEKDREQRKEVMKFHKLEGELREFVETKARDFMGEMDRQDFDPGEEHSISDEPSFKPRPIMPVVEERIIKEKVMERMNEEMKDRFDGSMDDLRMNAVDIKESASYVEKVGRDADSSYTKAKPIDSSDVGVRAEAGYDDPGKKYGISDEPSFRPKDDTMYKKEGTTFDYQDKRSITDEPEYMPGNIMNPRDYVGESNPQPSPKPQDRVGESNPQPAPKPQDRVGESNPQPSPKPQDRVGESNPQPSPKPMSQPEPMMHSQPQHSPGGGGGFQGGSGPGPQGGSGPQF